MKDKLYLGIEFGSTRIKAVLVKSDGTIVANGVHEWINKLENGLWMYSVEDVENGLRDSYAKLKAEYKRLFGEPLTELGGMGISAMMHGYIALDKSGSLLVPFRTWRNTNAAEAAEKLTREFNFNIPMRWSAAHLYQAVLNGEKHVNDIDYLTTLAGYVHYRLSGERVLGVGDASGMFPIGGDGSTYDGEMLDKFDGLIKDKNYRWKVRRILPEVLPAGKNAGRLSESGALLLDPSGELKPGVPMCPPEGDAGTGMVATNSVKERTGNVSAGTSVFAMVVLDKPLGSLHTEIDMVTTPDGKPVAMVHCNNCTSDINAWDGLFKEVLALFGVVPEKGELVTKLFNASVKGDPDCGGVTAYNFVSGEPIAGLMEGRPVTVRKPDGNFTLSNFMKALIYSSVAGLSLGMDILRGEGIVIDDMCGHGGFFKTPGVGQRAMSAATGAPVTVLQNAGEGGAWGMALLAAFTDEKCALPEYLKKVFSCANKCTVDASQQDKDDFAAFTQRFKSGLGVVKLASEVL